MNQPSGDMALSDDRYAAADQENPTIQMGFGTGAEDPTGTTDRLDPVSDIIENAALSAPQLTAPAVPLAPESTGGAQETTVAATGAGTAARHRTTAACSSCLKTPLPPPPTPPSRVQQWPPRPRRMHQPPPSMQARPSTI